MWEFLSIDVRISQTPRRRPHQNVRSPQLVYSSTVCSMCSELGAHIDGFIATAGHTIVVGSGQIAGRKADVIRAAWTAAEAALRTVVVGGTNGEVTKVMNKCVNEFNCHMVQGMLSHQLKQHVIDGVKCIISKETAEEKVR